MRAIYKIAKTELQMLFYSPIAWLLLLCFVFQTVFYYTSMLEGFVLDVENSGRAYWCSLRLFIMGAWRRFRIVAERDEYPVLVYPVVDNGGD